MIQPGETDPKQLESDDDEELSKATLEDLDPPENAEEEVKGGAPEPFRSSACQL